MRGFRVGVVLAICTAGAFGCGNVQSTDVDAGGDSPMDAAKDAPSDGMRDGAIPGVRYDVGYVDDFTLTPDITSVFGFVAVVNMGTAPLNLSSASVVTYLDDSPSVDWIFVRESASTAMLEPGRAGGFLTLGAKTRVLANGVVTEPVVDEILNFSMNFATPLSAGTRLNAQVVISIENVSVTLPFKIEVGSDVQFNSGKRVRSQ